MGKTQPQAPTPVDPIAVAGAQSASNKDTAQFQSQLNNGNAYSPYGTVTQAQDPNTNQWTSTTTFSPQEQALFDKGTTAQSSALDVANQQIGRVGQALGQGLTPGNIQTSFNPGQGVQGHVNTPDQQQAISQAEQASYGHAMNLLQPQMQQNAEHQNAALVAQGLNPNDAAWQNSQTLFNNGQNELLSQTANNAVLAGQQEQNTLYGQDLATSNFANTAAGQQFAQNQAQAAFGNQAEGQLFNQQAAAQSQPINEFAALMGQGQVQAPQGTGFNATGVAPTDVTGAYALNAQQQQQNYQSALQQNQSSMGGLMQLGSAAMMFM